MPGDLPAPQHPLVASRSHDERAVADGVVERMTELSVRSHIRSSGCCAEVYDAGAGCNTFGDRNTDIVRFGDRHRVFAVTFSEDRTNEKRTVGTYRRGR
jgi:hypothetical protein